MAAKRAPSTRAKAWREKTKVITPEVAELKRKEAAYVQQMRENIPEKLTPTQRTLIMNGNEALATKLPDKVMIFFSFFRATEEQDDEAFASCLRLANLSVNDIYEATFALRNLGNPAQARFGRDLVRACDRFGHAEATLQVVSARLRQDNAQPGVLRTKEVSLSLDRMKKLADDGDMRAVFLEGKVAYRRGHEEQAVKLYKKAMAMVLEEEQRTKEKGEPAKRERQKWDRQLDDELSSPWIELAYLHMKRKETAKAIEAYNVGVSQDDPMAYYNLSVLEWHTADGEPSMDWLFNVTKAAASGHFKAAYELGCYYADSPAHPLPNLGLESSPKVKLPGNNAVEAPPSPDGSPVKLSSAPTFLDTIKHFITTSLFKPTVDVDPKSNIEHYAALGQDPATRIRLAYLWLGLASRHHYLPACLPLVRLQLQEYISTSDNLTNDIGWLNAASLGTTPGAVKNPIYNVRAAADMLGMVFGACRKIADARARATTNADFQQMAAPWAEFGEVLDSYEDKLDGSLAEAKEIADAVGIDVSREEYGLMYLHRGKRGQGLLEYTE
ncbi:hypothetical protein MBLNU459_g7503t1 [Dothideomycetes sp. NU459]